MKAPMNRRSFVKKLAAFSVFSSLPLGFSLKAVAAEIGQLKNRAADRLGLRQAAAPMQDISGLANINSTEFNGDVPEMAHEILWNVARYIKDKGGIPPVEEEVDVLILGGGLGGLSAAYQLRGFKPVLLEQARQFGGNARGERYGNTSFPIGSVYISDPEPGTSKHTLLEELGILAHGRVENGEHNTVFYKNKFFQGFWQSNTDPEARKQFQSVFDELRSWTEEPAKVALLSFKTAPLSEEAKRLDRMSFEEWLKEKFGTVHPRIAEYFQLYGWSSFLGSIDELSALQMLDFISAETGKIMTFPGGLSAISQGLFEKLADTLPERNLRPSCLAVDIRKSGDRTQVCYNDATNTLRTIRAKTCVFAGSKFIANRIIHDAPEAQKLAWQEIDYRAYVVANVIFDGPIDCPSFELYCLDGEVPKTPTFVHPSPRPFSDVCFSSWANEDKARNGALSVYAGLAYDGSHAYLFSPNSHDNHKAKILSGLSSVFKALGRTRENVLGVRLTRWGHPMPLAYKGLLSKGVVQAGREPINNSLFFVNQDNWANPCFETTFREARIAAEKIKARLARG